MDTLTSPSQEVNKYEPFTEEEYKGMKEDLKGIKNFLPSHLMGIFWDRCNRIRGKREPQPCGCASAGGLWGDCVTTIQNFVKEKDGES